MLVARTEEFYAKKKWRELREDKLKRVEEIQAKERAISRRIIFKDYSASNASHSDPLISFSRQIGLKGIHLKGY